MCSKSFQFVGYSSPDSSSLKNTDKNVIYESSVLDYNKENKDTKCKGKLKKVFI